MLSDLEYGGKVAGEGDYLRLSTFPAEAAEPGIANAYRIDSLLKQSTVAAP